MSHSKHGQTDIEKSSHERWLGVLLAGWAALAMCLSACAPTPTTTEVMLTTVTAAPPLLAPATSQATTQAASPATLQTASSTPASTFAPAPTQGLAAYWPLNGDVQDASGHNNHGQLMGKVTFVEGRRGQALRLRGAGDYALAMDGATLQDGSAALTVAAWLKLDTLPAATTYYAPVAKEHSYRFIIGPDGGTHFVIATNAYSWYAPGTVVGFSSRLGVGKWYQLSATYDGNRLKVYLDGRLDGVSEPITGAIAAHAKRMGRQTTTIQAPITLGAKTSGNLDFTVGLIDEVRIYNRALSDSEVTALYAAN